MLLTRVFVVLAVTALLVACGGKTGVYAQDYAGSHTLTLVNASPRPVEKLFIHPVSKPERGASWTDVIAPGAQTTVKIASGHFELIAVSAERRIDATSRETPEAMTMLEVRGDQKLVFHDAGQAVVGLDAPGTLGVTFMITAATEPSTEPSAEPSTEASTSE